jgi:hypothetical protein
LPELEQAVDVRAWCGVDGGEFEDEGGEAARVGRHQVGAPSLRAARSAWTKVTSLNPMTPSVFSASRLPQMGGQERRQLEEVGEPGAELVLQGSQYGRGTRAPSYLPLRT